MLNVVGFDMKKEMYRTMNINIKTEKYIGSEE